MRQKLLISFVASPSLLIIFPLFLCISVILLQKAMVQYIIFRTVLLYLLKVCQSPGNKVSFLAIFGTFSRKSSEINLKDAKTQFYLLLLVIFQLCIPGKTACHGFVCGL